MTTDLIVHQIATAKIYADADFNCRGFIPLSSVVDLSKDIERNGLQQPITVQPYDKIPGFDWRIIQGHRRFTAMKLLNWTEVPALVKEGLTEVEALILNFGENLQRVELNILQEAKALKKMRDAGMTQMEMAKTLRMERPWVQTRLYVLDFPEDIQAEIADGMLNQAQIHEMHALEPEHWYEALRLIKDAKIRAGTKRLKVSVKSLQKPKAENLLKKKPRKGEDLTILLDHLIEKTFAGLHTRVLAWATGEIDTITLLKDVKKECDIIGVPYHIPTEGIAGL